MVYASAMRRAASGAGMSTFIYNTFMRRGATFFTTMFATAIAFELVWDYGIDSLWDSWNHGRQWKDIRGKYITSQDE